MEYEPQITSSQNLFNTCKLENVKIPVFVMPWGGAFIVTLLRRETGIRKGGGEGVAVCPGWRHWPWGKHSVKILVLQQKQAELRH